MDCGGRSGRHGHSLKCEPEDSVQLVNELRHHGGRYWRMADIAVVHRVVSQLSEVERDLIDQTMHTIDRSNLSPYSGYITWILLRIDRFTSEFVESLFDACCYDDEAEAGMNRENHATLTNESKKRILEICLKMSQQGDRLSTGGKQLLERMWRLVIVYAVMEASEHIGLQLGVGEEA